MSAIPWTRTLKAKLGIPSLIIFLLAVGVLGANIVTMRSMNGELAWVIEASKGRQTPWILLYHARRTIYGVESSRDEAELWNRVDEIEARLDRLEKGDRERGISGATDPTIQRGLREMRALLHDRVRPLLTTIVEASSPEQADPALRQMDSHVTRFGELVKAGVERAEDQAVATLARMEVLQYGFLVILVLGLGWFVYQSQSIGRRVAALSGTADAIARGDLTQSAPSAGTDEIGALGSSFNGMTEQLRAKIEVETGQRATLEKLLDAVRDSVQRLSSAAAEILAAASQQATGAQEQASAVAETSATVEEVTQTAEQSADRARSVGEAARRSEEVSAEGKEAIAETTGRMNDLEKQVTDIAEEIVALAERAQAIGEIVEAVNDIAEQTHILAVNAAIEASRAGEHGRGFAVVAGEVKALAAQSKKSTQQIRQILTEIQKATHTSVLSTEEGTKRVQAVMQAVRLADRTLASLASTVSVAATAATQIQASAGQQVNGMTQIQVAMRNIGDATHQGLSATRQTEEAARDLDRLASTLRELLEA